jgi:tetratricopeptide (TPR) repeat protein
LSQKREDFAAVQRFARRAARLAEREGLRKLAREAHSGLMVAASIDNRFDDAIVHGWTVYQLSLGDAVDESGVLGNLGQVLLDAGFNEASRSVFAAVVSRSLPANVILPALGGLALASAASRQDLTTEWAAREVLRFEPGSVPRYALASALFECGLALTRIGRMKTAMRCRSAALQLAEQYDFSELVSRFERIDGSMSNFHSAATLNKRAASVARELTLLEPRQLPQHVQLLAVSA